MTHPPKKKFRKLQGEYNFLNLAKNTKRKHTTNSVFRSWNTFFQDLNKQGCCLFPLLVNIVLEIVKKKKISREKEMQVMHIRKEEIKLSLFTIDILIYVEEPSESKDKTFKTK